MIREKEIWLVAGLGNPGDKYAYTWHNCGFLAVEYLADKYGIELSKSKWNSLYGKGRIDGHEVIIMKPKTFMNLSGEAIAPAADHFKIPPSRIIVVYDDIDIDIGKIRVRAKGSAGTHNGMKSVIKCLGSSEFPRVRIGTGPVPEHRELIEYVLEQIPRDQRQEMMDSFIGAADSVVAYINENSNS